MKTNIVTVGDLMKKLQAIINANGSYDIPLSVSILIEDETNPYGSYHEEKFISNVKIHHEGGFNHIELCV